MGYSLGWCLGCCGNVALSTRAVATQKALLLGEWGHCGVEYSGTGVRSTNRASGQFCNVREPVVFFTDSLKGRSSWAPSGVGI